MLMFVMFIFTVLSRDLLALLLSDSLTFLLSLVASLCHRHLLAHLPRLLCSHLLVLCGAFLFDVSFALFLGHILALLFGHLLAFLPVYLGALLVRHLFAHLSLLLVAFVLGHQRRNRLLDVLALPHRDQSAKVPGHLFTYLLLLCVGDSFGGALLFRHFSALLFGHLLTHLTCFVPAFLPRLIPALLLAINLNTLFLCDSHTLFLHNDITVIFILCRAFFLVGSVTLFFLLGFLHGLLYSLTDFLLAVKTLLLVVKSTLVLCHILNFSISRRFTHFIVDQVTLLLVVLPADLFLLDGALLLVLRRALLFCRSRALGVWHLGALLFRHRLDFGHLDSGALVLVVRCGVGHVDSTALLPRLVPALVLPYNFAHRMTGVSHAHKNAQNCYRMHCSKDS